MNASVWSLQSLQYLSCLQWCQGVICEVQLPVAESSCSVVNMHASVLTMVVVMVIVITYVWLTVLYIVRCLVLFLLHTLKVVLSTLLTVNISVEWFSGFCDFFLMELHIAKDIPLQWWILVSAVFRAFSWARKVAEITSGHKQLEKKLLKMFKYCYSNLWLE